MPKTSSSALTVNYQSKVTLNLLSMAEISVKYDWQNVKIASSVALKIGIEPPVCSLFKGGNWGWLVLPWRKMELFRARRQRNYPDLKGNATLYRINC